MAKKEIIWSSKANTELKEVLEFYNERNGNANYSSKLLNEIDDLLNTLSESEFIGRLTENKWPGTSHLGIREFTNQKTVRVG
jgi:toxin YoeB